MKVLSGKKFLVLFSLLFFNGSSCQSCSDPLINSWIKSTGSATSGSASGLSANVQTIAYDSNYVYIYASGIPSYSIGPWAANPNSAANKARYVQILRAPSLGTATVPVTKTATGMGPIGYLINGVPIYNMMDGFSYNVATGTCTTAGSGVWQRNAYAYEGVSFDSCGGHPDAFSSYHNHIDPSCLYTKNSAQHSQILGWMLDGYPLYGPYGYATGSKTVKLMKTGYAKRTDMNTGLRQTLISNTGIITQLSSDKYGPAIDLTKNLTIPWSGSTYPLGAFIQDWVWSNSGDLDAYNGRANSITPEYPNGIYAYFLPLDSTTLKPVVPYIIGPSYYGTPLTTQGPPSNTLIPSTATTYFSYSSNINTNSCGGTTSAQTTIKVTTTTPKIITSAASITTTPGAVIATCEDSQSNCQFWAKYCNVLTNINPHPCKLTCKICTNNLSTSVATTASQCIDSQNSCSFWANYCYLLSGQNPHPCRKTCRLC